MCRENGDKVNAVKVSFKKSVFSNYIEYLNSLKIKSVKPKMNYEQMENELSQLEDYFISESRLLNKTSSDLLNMVDDIDSSQINEFTKEIMRNSLRTICGSKLSDYISVIQSVSAAICVGQKKHNIIVS